MSESPLKSECRHCMFVAGHPRLGSCGGAKEYALQMRTGGSERNPSEWDRDSYLRYRDRTTEIIFSGACKDPVTYTEAVDREIPSKIL